MTNFVRYLHTTSTFNELGRVIIKTSRGKANVAIIRDVLNEKLYEYTLTMGLEAIDNMDRSDYRDYGRKSYLYGTFSNQTNILLISKMKNGHYRFNILKEYPQSNKIFVLLDTRPYVERDYSSLGILTPAKSTSEFTHDLIKERWTGGGGVKYAIEYINGKHLYYTFETLKILLRKFGIMLNGSNPNLAEQLKVHEYNIDTSPNRSHLSKAKKAMQDIKRFVNQHVMKKSVSVSKTLQKKSESTLLRRQ